MAANEQVQRREFQHEEQKHTRSPAVEAALFKEAANCKTAAARDLRVSLCYCAQQLAAMQYLHVPAWSAIQNSREMLVAVSCKNSPPWR
jgi:hypothetical protein